jgi:3-phenylpropionate/cinnamic acid dioxygenase small subunit
MTDHDQIRTLLAQYCHYMDDERLDDWADLFCGEATFTLMGRSTTGREEIRAFAHRRFSGPANRGKHLTLNSVVEVAARTATATSDFLVLFPSERGPFVSVAGRYDDAMVHEGGAWRFAARNVTVGEGWMRLPG